jgi:hypothetical protein
VTQSKNWSRKTGELTGNPFTGAAPAIPDDFKLASCAVGAHCPIDAAAAVPGLYLDFWRGLRASGASIGAQEPGSQSADGSPVPLGGPPPPPVLLSSQ